MKFAVLPLKKDDFLVVKDDGTTRTVIARAVSMTNAFEIAATEMGFTFEVAEYPGDYLCQTFLNKPMPCDLP